MNVTTTQQAADAYKKKSNDLQRKFDGIVKSPAQKAYEAKMNAAIGRIMKREGFKGGHREAKLQMIQEDWAWKSNDCYRVYGHNMVRNKDNGDD